MLIQSIEVIAESNSLSVIFQSAEDSLIRANHGLVIFDTVFIFIFVIAWLWVAYLFFTQKPTLPKTIIKVFAATIVFNIVDTLLLYWIDASDSVAIEESLFILGRNIIFTAICITYMLKSKRVKYTFVER